MSADDFARNWLRANGYDAVGDMIDALMTKWRNEGKKTRRDWWLVLAGGETGRSSHEGGEYWPVLRAAQIRRGMEPTPNAVCLSFNEVPPPVVRTGRWQPRRRQRTAA